MRARLVAKTPLLAVEKQWTGELFDSRSWTRDPNRQHYYSLSLSFELRLNGDVPSQGDLRNSAEYY